MTFKGPLQPKPFHDFLGFQTEKKKFRWQQRGSGLATPEKSSRSNFGSCPPFLSCGNTDRECNR